MPHPAPTDTGAVEAHDRGLAHDLDTIARRIVGRRRALAWVCGAGTSALLAGCGGGGGGDTASSSTATTATTGTTGTTTGTTGTTGTTTGTTTTGQCVADPTETNGPYPADGTNTSSGATSNVLQSSGIVRSDIRPSFISSTTVAAGVQVTLTLTVVNSSASCAPLAGYAVYLWHCDANGKYSLYDLPTESYLRGVGVTDANGQVTFTTIFPGCYAGRYPHIHFELFTSLSAATGGTGRTAKLISQMAMPAATCQEVYATSGYSTSATNFARTSTGSDNVFGDNTAAQLAQQTPSLTGSAAAGYTGTVTVGVSA